MFGRQIAYGSWGNSIILNNMKHRDHEAKKAYVKELWEEDHDKYYEWKEWCIRLNRLPEFFGTRDNPIPIDESKL